MYIYIYINTRNVVYFYYVITKFIIFICMYLCTIQAYMKACEFLSFWEKVDADGNGELDEKELEAFFKNKG